MVLENSGYYVDVGIVIHYFFVREVGNTMVASLDISLTLTLNEYKQFKFLKYHEVLFDEDRNNKGNTQNDG
ncbi:hypothetical protein BRE01_33440 [Brevibacillus reuszeri]|uniref:Uncharacterized protein n=1 Tax=Brevibacillus reuszeri TaxID=54915 RepID=A0ABQ0TQK0_9BACL|nr:hypothetical protein BRE01_33440 [Brevibacillus reuszeri]